MAALIACALLGWALVPTNPYGYYIFLRWIVCAICVFLTVQAIDLKRVGWAWTLGITAVIYNPLIRVYATREIWSVVNVATIAVLIGSIFMVSKTQKNSGRAVGKVC